MTLQRTLAKLALTNVIKDFICITEKSRSLIYLAITSETDKIISSGSFDNAISDHNVIYVTMNFFVNRPSSKIRNYKDYKNLDTEKVKGELDAAPWQIISIFDDVDCLWAWETLFTDTIKSHVRERKVKIRTENAPWMTGNVRKELNARSKCQV